MSFDCHVDVYTSLGLGLPESFTAYLSPVARVRFRGPACTYFGQNLSFCRNSYLLAQRELWEHNVCSRKDGLLCLLSFH